MRRLLVEADPRATPRSSSASTAVRLRPRPASRSGRAPCQRRAIANGLERLRHADPERSDRIPAAAAPLRPTAGAFGLRDRHLDWQVSTRDAATFAAREIALGIVLLPLARSVSSLFVPYRLTGFVARASPDGATWSPPPVALWPRHLRVWLVAMGASRLARVRTTRRGHHDARRARRCRRGALRARARVGRSRRRACLVAVAPPASRYASASAPPAIRAGRPARRGQPVAESVARGRQIRTGVQETRSYLSVQKSS